MRHAKLNNELARPIGIVDGTSVGGTRRPRTHTRALSDTVVTHADGSTYVIARRSNASNARKHTRRTVLAESTRADMKYQPVSRYSHNYNG